MPLKTTLLWSVVCLSLLGIGGALRWNIVRAEVPKPDFENLADYQRALETSTDPTAKAILQQIENGPADLVRERAAAQKEGILLDVSQLQKPMPRRLRMRPCFMPPGTPSGKKKRLFCRHMLTRCRAVPIPRSSWRGNRRF